MAYLRNKGNAGVQFKEVYQGIERDSMAYKLMNSMGWQEGEGLVRTHTHTHTHSTEDSNNYQTIYLRMMHVCMIAHLIRLEADFLTLPLQGFQLRGLPANAFATL